MKKIFANLLMTIGYLFNTIACVGGITEVFFNQNMSLEWIVVTVLLFLIPGSICLYLGRIIKKEKIKDLSEYEEQKTEIQDQLNKVEHDNTIKEKQGDNVIANGHSKKINYKEKKFYFQALVSILIMAFCSIVGGCIIGLEYFINAFFYVPFYIIVICYYLWIVWSKQQITGERILMLPLLNKMGIYKDLKSDYEIRRKLVYNFAPVLFGTILISVIVVINGDYINPGEIGNIDVSLDGYLTGSLENNYLSSDLNLRDYSDINTDVSIGSIVLSIPVFVGAFFFLFAYGSNWVNKKKEEVN